MDATVHEQLRMDTEDEQNEENELKKEKGKKMNRTVIPTLF